MKKVQEIYIGSKPPLGDLGGCKLFGNTLIKYK